MDKEYVKMRLFIMCVSGVIGLLLLLSGYVIANDRTRAFEDIRITERVDCKLDKISSDIVDIKVSVAKIVK